METLFLLCFDDPLWDIQIDGRAPGRPMKFPVTEVKQFVGGLDHAEGIAVAADGTVYAGGEAGQVYRISPDGEEVTEIANTGGFCLGITLDRKGNIFICDLTLHSVIKVNPSRKMSVFADSTDTRKFQTPNFSVFDSDGNLYLSDSGQWKKNNGLIYKIRPDGKASIFHPGPFAFANGLALSVTEDELFVVESNANRVTRVEILPDGTVGDTAVFCKELENVPDGIAFDAHGNLYATCFGLNRIYFVDPQGRVELLCEDVENVALSAPSNCAFGGKDFDQLNVANIGGHSISVLDLKTAGQPLYAHKVGR